MWYDVVRCATMWYDVVLAGLFNVDNPPNLHLGPWQEHMAYVTYMVVRCYTSRIIMLCTTWFYLQHPSLKKTRRFPKLQSFLPFRRINVTVLLPKKRVFLLFPAFSQKFAPIRANLRRFVYAVFL